MKMEFIVYGKPQGKARPRFSRRSNSIYTPKKTEMYEAQIAKAYKERIPDDQAGHRQHSEGGI